MRIKSLASESGNGLSGYKKLAQDRVTSRTKVVDETNIRKTKDILTWQKLIEVFT